MISGATRLFVILGDPIAKVRSPEAFNSAFERHGIDAVLVPLECAPGDLRRHGEGAQAHGQP